MSTGPCGGCDLGNGYCKSRFSDDCVSFIVGGELDPCDSSETSGGIIIGADTGDFSGDFGLGGGGSSSSSSSGGTFSPKTTADSCSLFGTGSGGGLGGGGGGTSGGSGEDNVIDGSGGLDGFS